VTGPRELDELDVDAVCGKLIRQHEGLAGVGDAIRGAVREKERLMIQHRNRFALG